NHSAPQRLERHCNQDFRINGILVTQLLGFLDNWVTGTQFVGLGIGETKHCPAWQLEGPAFDGWRLRNCELNGWWLTRSPKQHQGRISKARKYLDEPGEEIWPSPADPQSIKEGEENDGRFDRRKEVYNEKNTYLFSHGPGFWFFVCLSASLGNGRDGRGFRRRARLPSVSGRWKTEPQSLWVPAGYSERRPNHPPGFEFQSDARGGDLKHRNSNMTEMKEYRFGTAAAFGELDPRYFEVLGIKNVNESVFQEADELLSEEVNHLDRIYSFQGKTKLIEALNHWVGLDDTSLRRIIRTAENLEKTMLRHPHCRRTDVQSGEGEPRSPRNPFTSDQTFRALYKHCVCLPEYVCHGHLDHDNQAELKAYINQLKANGTAEKTRVYLQRIFSELSELTLKLPQNDDFFHALKSFHPPDCGTLQFDLQQFDHPEQM
ncbi:unnamed protein product, partial [Notodromas monacha]